MIARLSIVSNARRAKHGYIIWDLIRFSFFRFLVAYCHSRNRTVSTTSTTSGSSGSAIEKTGSGLSLFHNRFHRLHDS